MRYLSTALACASSLAAVVLAPIAVADPPDCTQTAPRTTQCRTSGGSAQIVTSPQQRNYNSYPWYGYGWGLSFGGGGFSIGGRR
jgi:uncharacterized membrane protein